MNSVQAHNKKMDLLSRIKAEDAVANANFAPQVDAHNRPSFGNNNNNNRGYIPKSNSMVKSASAAGLEKSNRNNLHKKMLPPDTFKQSAGLASLGRALGIDTGNNYGVTTGSAQSAHSNPKDPFANSRVSKPTSNASANASPASSAMKKSQSASRINQKVAFDKTMDSFKDVRDKIDIARKTVGGMLDRSMDARSNASTVATERNRNSANSLKRNASDTSFYSKFNKTPSSGKSEITDTDSDVSLRVVDMTTPKAKLLSRNASLPAGNRNKNKTYSSFFQKQTDAVKTFGGPLGRTQRNIEERDAGDLSNTTGIIGIWRPKRFGDNVNAKMQAICEDAGRNSALGFYRDSAAVACTGCARVGPNSRCFCGFTFAEHSPAARLSDPDGFGWCNSLGRDGRCMMDRDLNWKIESGGTPMPNEFPCNRFRFIPGNRGEAGSLTGSLQDNFKARFGGNAHFINRGANSNSHFSLNENVPSSFAAKCRNCGQDSTLHDVESEACPGSNNRNSGTYGMKFQSAFECVVCNRRWEDHETVLLSEQEMEQMKQTLSTGKAFTRAVSVEQQLRENSFGILGNYTDSDHYAVGLNRNATLELRNRINRENDFTREQLEMNDPRFGRNKIFVPDPQFGRVERECETFYPEYPRYGPGGQLIRDGYCETGIDTTAAYRGGNGRSLYGREPLFEHIY